MDRFSRPWSVPVAVADIPETGGHYEIAADDVAREAVAKFAGLRTLDRLEAVFDIDRRGEGAVVRGEVAASVGQTCVVTLEPIENDIREAIDLVFEPAAGALNEEDKHKARQGEPPEPLENGTLDLGAVATEFLMLALDPYPRKPGAEFTRHAEADEGAHPFAALAALKKKS